MAIKTAHPEVRRVFFDGIVHAVGLFIATKTLELTARQTARDAPSETRCHEADLLLLSPSQRRSRKIVNLLGTMGDEQSKARLEANRFYESRVETIRTRLWTALSWMAAADGAALVLAFKEGKLQTQEGTIVVIGQPVLVMFLAVFVFAASRLLKDTRDGGIHHIRSNMQIANLVLGLEPGGQSPESVFNVFRWLAVGGMCAGVLLFIAGILGTTAWLTGWQIPHLLLNPA